MPHVQIRNVPPDVHRVLKVRAAAAGLSLSEYLLREVRRSAERPTMDEMVARVRRRPMQSLRVSAADAIAEERRARDRR